MSSVSNRVLLLAIMSGLVALPAAANVTGVLTATTGTIKVKGQPLANYSGAVINAALGGLSLTGGGVESTSQLTGGVIEFQNGTISGGPGGSSSAFTEVAVTFQNTSSKSVIPVLDSTLLPAGLGFLIGDIASDKGPGLCSPDALGNCGQTSKGANWSNVSVATAGFNFDILDNGVSIYSLAGSMAIDAHGNIIENLGAARSTLINFGLDTIPGDTSAIGYSWDATHITVPLSGALAPGASRTLTYRVSTYATSTGSCAPVPGSNAYNATCIIGYSVFGDPVGGKGVITNIGIQSNLASLAGPLSASPGQAITGIAFNTLSPLLSPTFDSNTGRLGVFQGVAGVPEPASWALMIGGFGMVGGALRRRRYALA